jgi:hypothetical protein
MAVRTTGDTALFGGTVTVTVPPPVPLAGAAASPDAVHPHAALDAITAMSAVPPDAVAARFTGLIANEQTVPNWVIEKVAPLTEMLPLLGLTPGLGSAVKLIGPGPVPLDADVTVIQVSDGVAVHAHDGPVAMLKLPGPPLAGALPAAGLRA